MNLEIIPCFLPVDHQITGSFTLEEVQKYASMLENPLQNPLKILESSEISATYGAETISQGVKAGIAGLMITLIFMVIYYRAAGGVALLHPRGDAEQRGCAHHHALRLHGPELQPRERLRTGLDR